LLWSRSNDLNDATNHIREANAKNNHCERHERENKCQPNLAGEKRKAWGDDAQPDDKASADDKPLTGARTVHMIEVVLIV
jgi:hypothetical protein